MHDLKITLNTAKVLRVFVDEPQQHRYGFELMQRTGLPSGTLYPILARLESAGWLGSRREIIEPAREGRPARRFYLITKDGLEAARLELARLSQQLQPQRQLPRGIRPEGGLA